jgi:serine/threonine protein kinase
MPDAADDFLKSVLRSGLLDKAELTTALRSLPKDRLDKPREVANHLIQQGKLSRFQAHKLLAGATLGLRLGDYLIQTPIGRGGMGTVFLATDRRNGRLLAIKALPPKRAREEERYLARFQREMELSQKVSHPHIAQTHEAGVSQGVYFIAMEYIPGQSLYRLVTSKGPLTVERAAQLFAEVASALQHAHDLGLIHRDLKPSNIMVTPNDHAKVLDLGLAMMEGEVGADVEIIGGRGYVVGSVDYMAPEQTLDATNVDSRSDLYAMGCVLYFALTGKPPFPGGKTMDKINAHRHQEPDPVQWRNQDIPDGFAAIIHKLMAKNPADRYPNGAAVRAELLAFCPKDSARPVEKEGDQSQQAAARELETAPLSPEILKAEPLQVAEPLPFVQGVPVDDTTLATELYGQSQRKEVWATVLGVSGFWIAVVLVLLVIWLLK